MSGKVAFPFIGLISSFFSDLHVFNLLQLVFSSCVAALKCRAVLQHHICLVLLDHRLYVVNI